MKLKKADRARLSEMVTEVPHVLAWLGQEKRLQNSEIYWLLNPLSPEAVIFAHAMAPNLKAQKEIDLYLGRMKGVKPSVDGRTLRKMGFLPSPVYNTVLKDLLTAKLDGKVGTPEDEEQFVIERFSIYDKESKKQCN